MRATLATVIVAAVLAALVTVAPAAGAWDEVPASHPAPVAAEVIEVIEATGTAAVLVETRAGAAGDVATPPGRVLRTGAPLVAATVDAAQLAELRRSPDVRRVVANRAHLVAPAPATDVGQPEGTDASPPAIPSTGPTGAGETIAVLDTGVDRDHPSLAGRVVGERCFSGTGPSGANPQGLCPGPNPRLAAGTGAARPCTGAQTCAHGTQVAGVAAGRPSAPGQPQGIAPAASVLAAQVFTRITHPMCGVPSCIVTFDADLLEGLSWVHDEAATRPIAAVNLSLGSDVDALCDDHPLRDLVELLDQRDVATVVASGNSGRIDGLAWPACTAGTISVGAVTSAPLAVAAFSSSGPGLSLLAPGVGITSPIPGGGFATGTGTSLAAPQVTGALAVLREARGRLPVGQAELILRQSGLPVLDPRNGVTTPLLQLGAALAGTRAIGGLAPPTLAGDTLTVTGWAIDPDDTGPITVTISIDGEARWTGPAADLRPEVAAAYRGFGPAHGFSAPIPGVTPGAHDVCAHAQDLGPLPGPDAVVACTSTGTGFTDIAADHPFQADIAWLAHEGITTGFPDGTFRPTGTVSRQTLAGFLFRMFGDEPLPPGPPAPELSDVGPGHLFHDAISWMARAGLTTGYADGTFRPTEPVSRQVVAAFLHRLARVAPSPPAAAPFLDVPLTHPFGEAIAWMTRSGITTGYPDDTFRPAAPVARQAIAAFLHRLPSPA